MFGRLTFLLGILIVSERGLAAVGPCASPATLINLQQAGVLPKLTSVLQGQEVAAGSDYIWSMDRSTPFKLRVQSEAPHQLSVFINEAGGYVDVRQLCADGTNTILRLQPFHFMGEQKVQIQIVNRGGRQIAEVFLNGEAHSPAAEVGALSVRPSSSGVSVAGPSPRGRD